MARYYLQPEFTPAEFVRVTLELLNGVAFLHGRSVAHRDLKPANVLLEGAGRKVKLADFGQARKNRKTMVTRGVGTLEYMVGSPAVRGHFGRLVADAS